MLRENEAVTVKSDMQHCPLQHSEKWRNTDTEKNLQIRTWQFLHPLRTFSLSEGETLPRQSATEKYTSPLYPDEEM